MSEISQSSRMLEARQTLTIGRMLTNSVIDEAITAFNDEQVGARLQPWSSIQLPEGFLRLPPDMEVNETIDDIVRTVSNEEELVIRHQGVFAALGNPNRERMNLRIKRNSNDEPKLKAEISRLDFVLGTPLKKRMTDQPLYITVGLLEIIDPIEFDTKVTDGFKAFSAGLPRTLTLGKLMLLKNR